VQNHVQSSNTCYHGCPCTVHISAQTLQPLVPNAGCLIGVTCCACTENCCGSQQQWPPQATNSTKPTPNNAHCAQQPVCTRIAVCQTRRPQSSTACNILTLTATQKPKAQMKCTTPLLSTACTPHTTKLSANNNNNASGPPPNPVTP
jgi:hypothetical protein